MLLKELDVSVRPGLDSKFGAGPAPTVPQIWSHGGILPAEDGLPPRTSISTVQRCVHFFIDSKLAALSSKHEERSVSMGHPYVAAPRKSNGLTFTPSSRRGKVPRSAALVTPAFNALATAAILKNGASTESEIDGQSILNRCSGTAGRDMCCHRTFYCHRPKSGQRLTHLHP